MKYRLYVDEYGNSSLQAVQGESRYLSLTGIALDIEYVRTTVYPELEALKAAYFPTHPDQPLMLHRKELLQRNYPFASLRRPATRTRFFNELFALLERWEYTVFTTTIDKAEHLQRYGSWSRNPYHFCLEVILERYVRWLEMRVAHGDVIVEARGQQEDRKLEAVFAGVCNRGTDFIKTERFEACLTSKSLKVADKLRNIAGLQLADLMAYPAFVACYSVQGGSKPVNDFNDRMAAVLNSRGFYRSPGGRMDGYGRKWLP